MDRRTVRTGPKKKAVKMDSRRSSVQEFLDRLARALTAGDGRAAASMWAVPALIISDKGAQAVNSLQEVETFFGGAREQYNAQGITDTRAEIVNLEWATDRLAMVHVRWPYLDERGQERGEEASTYVLKRDDDGNLKLHVALMRGASTPD